MEVSLKTIEVSLKIVEIREKTVKTLRKDSLNFYKKPVKTSQRAKSILPKNKPNVWALIARTMGNSCPTHGLPMPIAWAADAHPTGTNRPCAGYKQTMRRA